MPRTGLPLLLAERRQEMCGVFQRLRAVRRERYRRHAMSLLQRHVSNFLHLQTEGQAALCRVQRTATITAATGSGPVSLVLLIRRRWNEDLQGHLAMRSMLQGTVGDRGRSQRS